MKRRKALQRTIAMASTLFMLGGTVLQESGISFAELGGVQPNPRDTLVYKGIEKINIIIHNFFQVKTKNPKKFPIRQRMDRKSIILFAFSSFWQKEESS